MFVVINYGIYQNKIHNTTAFVRNSFTTSTDKKQGVSHIQNVKLFTTVFTFLSLNIRFNPFSLGGFVGL